MKIITTHKIYKVFHLLDENFVEKCKIYFKMKHKTPTISEYDMLLSIKQFVEDTKTTLVFKKVLTIQCSLDKIFK